MGMGTSFVDRLAGTLSLGTLLELVTARYGSYELSAHWTQGEFHHDVVISLPDQLAAARDLGGAVLVVATNCNGGIKEVLVFDEVPDRAALWHHRCPAVAEFQGALTAIKARATTPHWFDPCEILVPDARSELLPEHRQRQAGGGWEARPSTCGSGRRA